MSGRFFGRGPMGMDEGGVDGFNEGEDEEERRGRLGRRRATTRRDT